MPGRRRVNIEAEPNPIGPNNNHFPFTKPQGLADSARRLLKDPSCKLTLLHIFLRMNIT
jgi:hypothetical protein